MNLLVIEDNIKIATFLKQGLEAEGDSVECANDGEAGLRMARTGKFDILVVDLMLPKLDGLSVIEKLREENILTPVIILSAKRSLDDRIMGLQKGGDDYLTKPFAISELIARAKALARRSGTQTNPLKLSIGEFELNLALREVRRSGKLIDLQLKEFVLLEFLVKNAERIVSKGEILKYVWNYRFDPQTNVVDVLVCRLRNKIDKGFDSKKIHTIRGLGYVFRK